MAKPKLAVVIGSIRTNRFADHPAQWIAEIAAQSGKFRRRADRPQGLSTPVLRGSGLAGLRAVQERDRAALAKEAGGVRRLCLHGRRIQSRADRRAQERRSITPTTNGPTSRSHSWATRRRRRAGGRATPAERDRAADGADPAPPFTSSCRSIWLSSRKARKLGDFDFLNQNAKDMLDQLSWWTNALKTARDKAELRAA